MKGADVLCTYRIHRQALFTLGLNTVVVALLIGH